MIIKTRTHSLAAATLPLFLSLAACSRKPKVEADSGTTTATAPAGAPQSADHVPAEDTLAAPVAQPAPTPSPSPEGIDVIQGAELVRRIADSSAKATLVNAWASWCGPCRREFPMLKKVGAALKSKGVELVFITVDDEASYGKALEFAKEQGVSLPLLAASRPLGPFKRAMHPKWPGMLPATFLFDDTGKVRYFWPGEVFENELVPVVEGLLAGDDIDGYAHVGLQRGTDSRY